MRGVDGIGAWDVCRDGRVIPYNNTYEEFCTTRCTELSRDEALALFREARGMYLPEGF